MNISLNPLIQHPWEPVFYSIPEGSIGDWEIKTVEASRDNVGSHSMRHRKPVMNHHDTYQSLLHHGHVVMSDSPTDLNDYDSFVDIAFGSVLVTGLGLGVLPRLLLMSDDISNVTVIERSSDVINLISPHIKDIRFNVVHADAFEWMPEKNVSFDFAWHNIWASVRDENLEEMKPLPARFSALVAGGQCCSTSGCCENVNVIISQQASR